MPVKVTGRTKIERIGNFARNSEEALRQASHDCSVGFINTYAHDVIIPQGGVQQGSLTANARRFSSPLVRQTYLLAKTANPKSWLHRSIENRQYDPSRYPRVVAVSNMVKRHLEQFHHIPRQQIHVVPNAIDPKRLAVSQPGAVRCAFRNRLGLEPARPDRSVCRPQLRAQGPEAASGGPGRPPEPESERPAHSPAGLRQWRARPFSQAGEPARTERHSPFPGLLPRSRDLLLVERLLRPAHVLRPVLAGRSRSTCLRPARDHDRAKWGQRALDRWSRRLRPDGPRRAGRADHRDSTT